MSGCPPLPPLALAPPRRATRMRAHTRAGVGVSDIAGGSGSGSGSGSAGVSGSAGSSSSFLLRRRAWVGVGV